MYQLKYLDNLVLTLEMLFYVEVREIPDKVLKFINREVDSLIIFDNREGNYYCSKCLNKLDSYYCSYCDIKYSKLKSRISTVCNIKSKSILDNYYSFFDIKNNTVVVYLINYTYYFYKNNDINIEIRINRDGIYYNKDIKIIEALNIREDGVYDLYNNKLYTYYKYSKMESFNKYSYLYTGNLGELKYTFFKYIPLQDCIEYFKNNKISISNMLYMMINNPSFEYLIKYKLYNLAFSNFKYMGSFYKSFGVGRDYLDFLVDNDITKEELEILKLIKIKDITLIRELNSYDLVDCLKELYYKYHLSINKIIKYFNNKGLDYCYLEYYLDYISILDKLKINLSNKDIVYPDNFLLEYKLLVSDYELSIKPNTNKLMSKIGNLLDFNSYEDDKYIIISPKSIKEIMDEAIAQKNCLREYIDSYLKGESQIYFMRRKRDKNKSFITIEVCCSKVIQAFTKCNEIPDKKYLDIISKWEKSLVPIDLRISWFD